MSNQEPPSLWDRACVYVQVKLLRWAIWFGNLGKPTTPAPFPPSRQAFIRSSDGKRRIKLLFFDPPNSNPGPKPVYINFHGSGFIQPSLGIDGRMLTYIAREVGCIVIDGDYRKAPEHPFPAAYDDAYRMVSWMLENADRLFDVDRVAVGGVSAGGSLALAVTANMPPNTIKGVSVIGRTRPIGPHPSRHWEMMRSAYLGKYMNTKDARLSPKFGDITRFPGGQTVFIASAEYDYLDAEAQEFRDLLVKSGKEPLYMHVEGMGHGYVMTDKSDTAAAKKRDETFAMAAEALKRAFGL
ncbi:alpha/beta-hydrolase [Dacryopinax primogenitus]|uniref:Alpha/beta-hydrolase n=1 Tax=Dacryopinax primogenitus (strain DJM 731) TaxID=1858805 RepID=M5G1C8_DACPD|nr:alpha/beta-hydrolase [Dacryopinax primogenitus]EJT99631.1 alpha/beta-hydrolase [Dacryopinax primogenitus]